MDFEIEYEAATGKSSSSVISHIEKLNAQKKELMAELRRIKPSAR
jgi:hypothetical protein